MLYWIALDGPHTSLNGRKVHRMKLSKNVDVPLSMGSADMMAQVAPASRHLVINCHGTPDPAALHVGVDLTLNNVNAFSALAAITTLRVIWIHACNLAGSEEGGMMCSEMAKRAAAYVTSAVASVPNAPAPPNCVEDYRESTPVYFDPRGEKIDRATFFAQGKTLGFRLV